MATIKVNQHIGLDGILHLQIPTDISSTDVEVTVSYHPKISVVTDEQGWPIGFFDKFYGICQDDPIMIDDEKEFKSRAEICRLLLLR